MGKARVKAVRQLHLSKRDVFEATLIQVDDESVVEFFPPVGSQLMTEAKGQALINRLDKESIEEFGHDTALGRRRKKRQFMKEQTAKAEKINAEREQKEAKANSGKAEGKSK